MTKQQKVDAEDGTPVKKPKEGLALLREPFPDHMISKLPKPTKRQTEEVRNDFKKGIRCDQCGQWHHPKVQHLDYVGHAALTDRLLDCDPEWNWEPVAFTDHGTPLFDENGGMWIRLTVCGQTRLGYGHPDGKRGGDAIKEVIGDALRNAAMRFGAALDLWHKGDLHPSEPTEGEVQNQPSDDPPFDPVAAANRVKDRIRRCQTRQQLTQVWGEEKDTVIEIGQAQRELGVQIYNLRDQTKANLADDPAMQAPPVDDRPNADLDYDDVPY